MTYRLVRLSFEDLDVDIWTCGTGGTSAARTDDLLQVIELLVSAWDDRELSAGWMDLNDFKVIKVITSCLQQSASFRHDCCQRKHPFSENIVI